MSTENGRTREEIRQIDGGFECIFRGKKTQIVREEGAVKLRWYDDQSGEWKETALVKVRDR